MSEYFLFWVEDQLEGQFPAAVGGWGTARAALPSPWSRLPDVCQISTTSCPLLGESRGFGTCPCSPACGVQPKHFFRGCVSPFPGCCLEEGEQLGWLAAGLVALSSAAQPADAAHFAARLRLEGSDSPARSGSCPAARTGGTASKRRTCGLTGAGGLTRGLTGAGGLTRGLTGAGGLTCGLTGASGLLESCWSSGSGSRCGICVARVVPGCREAEELCPPRPWGDDRVWHGAPWPLPGPALTSARAGRRELPPSPPGARGKAQGGWWKELRRCRCCAEMK